MQNRLFFSCCFALSLTACGEATEPVELQFAARIGAEPVRCGARYAALDRPGSAAKIADARLYLSEFALRDEGGTWHPLSLEQDGVWQHEDLALLDFEDGSESCNGGTRETNSVVRGTIAQGHYTALRFVLGVPRARNHLDSTQAPSPLNLPAMFWSWQSGYKFLRFDLLPEAGEIPRWNVHIGASGCESAAAVRAPAAPCARSHRSTIVLENFDWQRDRIELDFGALLRDADLTHNTEDTAPGCMSNPAESAECSPIFDALGLSFASGSCVDDCRGQRVFSLTKR